MTVTKWATVAFLGVAVGVLAGCHSEPPESAAAVPVVKVASIERGQRALPDLFGTVVASVQTSVGFEVAGRIATREVARGASVKAGQVLATLDPAALTASLDSARATRAQAAAQADFARQNVLRVRALFEKKLASPQELDQAVSQDKSADAGLAAAVAAQDRAALSLGYATLKAPFDGVVTAVSSDVGAVVSPGQPVLTVAKAGARSILVAVPEARMSHLPQTAEVLLPPGFSALTQPVQANGFEAEGAADAASRTVAVRYHLPADASLALGQSVRLRFADQAAPKTVPIGAITGEHDQAMLWVVQQNTVRPYPVTVLALSDERAIIKTNLPLGTVVVALGGDRLHPGQTITIQPPLGIDVPPPVVQPAVQPVVTEPSSS